MPLTKAILHNGLLAGKRFFIIDRDAIFSPRFKSILDSSDIEILLTAYQAPNMNAYAERFVGSIKSECLEQMIYLGLESLVRAIAEYATHYHDERSQVARGPNERWATDFMHDTLAYGEKMRVLTVIDVFNRECLALVAKKHFRGEDVARTLTRLLGERGRPKTIQCDQGTEFTSLAMDHWAYWNKVRLDFSRRGKPGDNARNEAFNGTLRRECLTQHYFLNLEEAQRALDTWRVEYNNDRPHGSLNQITPAQYKARWRKTEDLSGPKNLSY